MEIVENIFSAMGLDFYGFIKIALVLLVGSVLLSLFGRFVFGKRSMVSCAVSSAIGILFVYAVAVVLKSSGLQHDILIAPLPFIDIAGTELVLFSFRGTHYATICSEILSMVILAFLMNLVDGWMPKGKNLITWLLLRCLTVAIAYILHLLTVWLFHVLLPQGLVTYAPTVLLGLLIIMLLTGGLKIIVGAFLATVNPIIGGLYTFFFATVIGKQVTKAVLTAALLTGLVLLLRYLGIFSISIVLTALYAYVPFALGLLILWYITNRLF